MDLYNISQIKEGSKNNVSNNNFDETILSNVKFIYKIEFYLKYKIIKLNLTYSA